MTGIVILNVAFVAIVLAGIVGLLGWSIVSSMHRREIRRTHSRPTSRAYRMPELTSDVVEREYTDFRAAQPPRRSGSDGSRRRRPWRAGWDVTRDRSELHPKETRVS